MLYCRLLTPVTSSGVLPNMLYAPGERLFGSRSLPVISSSDSSKDEAEDRHVEEELESFRKEIDGTGEPPHPLSEQGDSSSACWSRDSLMSRDCGPEPGLGVMTRRGMVPR